MEESDSCVTDNCIIERNVYLFEEKEILALYRILEKQWIDHSDEEAQKVVDRIAKIAREKNA